MSKVNINKIAKKLGATCKGKVAARSGYFGAMLTGEIVRNYQKKSSKFKPNKTIKVWSVYDHDSGDVIAYFDFKPNKEQLIKILDDEFGGGFENLSKSEIDQELSDISVNLIEINSLDRNK